MSDKNKENSNQRADQFDKGVSFPLVDVDYSKSREQINSEQHEKDAICMEMIDEAVLNEKTGEDYTLETMTLEAVRQGKIDKDYAELLRFYYHDGMETYKEVFFSISNKLGIKQKIKIVDPSSGAVKVDDARLGQITPNNCAILEFMDRLEYEAHLSLGSNRNRDFFDIPETLNPVYLTMPGLKSIKRALAKYEKYWSAYEAKKENCIKKYGEDTQACRDAISALVTPTEALGDIARCSISVKRLQNIRMWANFFEQSPDIRVDPQKTKDKFCANNVRNAHKFTANNFRNYVCYAELPNGIKIEIQLKITALDEVDKLTHPLYEKLRDLQREIKSEKDKKEKLKMQMEIYKLNTLIQAIYRTGIEKHNQNEVFDKVYRVEEQNRISGNQRLNSEGLDMDALQILERNFLARPKQAFVCEDPIWNIPVSIKREFLRFKRNPEDKTISEDMKKVYEIYDNSPYLQKLFKNCPKHVRETMHRYMHCITGRYMGTVYGDRKELLSDDSLFEGRSKEEDEMLSNVDKKHLNLQAVKKQKDR